MHVCLCCQKSSIPTLICVQILRKKISQIIAAQVGEPDEIVPDSLEETRYWCCVTRKKVERENVRLLSIFIWGFFE